MDRFPLAEDNLNLAARHFNRFFWVLVTQLSTDGFNNNWHTKTPWKGHSKMSSSSACRSLTCSRLFQLGWHELFSFVAVRKLHIVWWCLFHELFKWWCLMMFRWCLFHKLCSFRCLRLFLHLLRNASQGPGSSAWRRCTYDSAIFRFNKRDVSKHTESY